jgi:phosphoribosyl 1,2-cyclic phosphodiesterase
LPAPLLPWQIKSKISAVLERLNPEDIVSERSREKFLAGLPPWLFGTVGGNTTCVSVALNDPGQLIIFDCGSGLKELGGAFSKEPSTLRHYHFFLTHFHWDHLQGLPFFGPGFDPSIKIDFYSPKSRMGALLCGQMIPPYFPVGMESMAAMKTFHTLTEPVSLIGVKITWKKMHHPGDCYSYKLDDGTHTFIFSTDCELSVADFIRDEENTAYFQGADLVVIDSQYTLDEAVEKLNWGHSAFSMAVDFAANWDIKHLVFFHHDPSYDDKKLFHMLQSAQWYMERMNIQGIKLTLAVEGLEISL